MNTPRNHVLTVAGAFGLLGVALGAFGTHSLKATLSDAALGWWQTAVEYQLIHAAVLLAIAFAPGKKSLVAWILGTGIVLFSGSLYVMATTGWTTLGLVTPIGGVALLAGWGCLVIGWVAKPKVKN